MLSALSEQPEIHLKRHSNANRLAVALARFEEPGLHFLQGLLVEAHAQAAYHAQVARTAIRADHGSQRHRSLVLGFASFFGKIRLRSVLGFRRCDADVT